MGGSPSASLPDSVDRVGVTALVIGVALAALAIFAIVEGSQKGWTPELRAMGIVFGLAGAFMCIFSMHALATSRAKT